MVTSFETTLTASRPVAQVLGDDWVEIEPGIYVQRVDGQPALRAVPESAPASTPFQPTT
jgi:hypothetical protein